MRHWIFFYDLRFFETKSLSLSPVTVSSFPPAAVSSFSSAAVSSFSPVAVLFSSSEIKGLEFSSGDEDISSSNIDAGCSTVSHEVILQWSRSACWRPCRLWTLMSTQEKFIHQLWLQTSISYPLDLE